MSLPDVVEKPFNDGSDTDFEAKNNPVLELYDMAYGRQTPRQRPEETVVCMDEFGRSIRHLVRPRQWARVIVMGERGEAPAAPTAPCYLHSHCPSFATSWLPTT